MDADVLVAGEVLVDFIAEEGVGLADAESFRRRAGGAPANVAAGLSRLGVPAWLCARVGDDAFGGFLVRALAERDVPDWYLQVDDHRRTSVAFAAGESFSFYRDADRHLDTAVVPGDALDAASWVVFGGIALSAEPARSAVFDLVGRARDRGCRVLFDPNRRPEVWASDDDYDATVADAVVVADVVCASPEDFAGTRFDGDQPERVARTVLDAGPDLAVLTRGRAGALAAASADSPWGERVVSHAGFDVDAADPTGAGDAFAAGLLAGLREDRDLGDALAFASAAGALATTGVGAMDALPDRDAVTELCGETVEE